MPWSFHAQPQSCSRRYSICWRRDADDFVRVHEARERDHSYARFQERPFPGNPITAGLTNHEAAELSGRLYSAHTVSEKLPTVTEPRNSP
jgi:hypothetical protein